MEPPTHPPDGQQEPIQAPAVPVSSSFQEVSIGPSNPILSLRTDTGFIVRTFVQSARLRRGCIFLTGQAIEWFRRLVLHNNPNIDKGRLSKLEERMEQLRREAERRAFQDIEGIVDPMVIRLKVQDARQDILNSYHDNPKLFDLYKTLSELPPPAAGEFAGGKPAGLGTYSCAATDLIRGSFFSERLQQRKSMSWGVLKSFFLSTLPIFTWLPKYRLPDLRGDLLAALTVAAMLIPQGMSYALLAGLPPEWGLYAGLVPMVIYSFLGTSRELSIGPAAMVSLTIPSALTASGLLPSTDDPTRSYEVYYNALALCLAMQTGVILLAGGILQVGFIVENLLSAPVLSGFTQGAAVLIVLSQLKHVLGHALGTGHADTLQDILAGLIRHIKETNPYAIIMGVGVALCIIGLRKLNKQIPAALVMLMLTTFITWITDASKNNALTSGLRGILILGYQGSSFPVQLMGQAALLALLAFMESISVAKKFAGNDLTLSDEVLKSFPAQNHYNVHTNQELVALGMCNFVGSFFNAFPSSASLARTAVNYQVGSRSPLCNALTAGLVALAILFLTRLLYYTPYACLGAIVITAAVHLIDPAEWKRLWRGDEHGDLLMLALTMLVTIFLSPVVGVGVAIGLSLLEFIYRAARPAFLELGRLSGTVVYRDVATNPSAVVVPGVVVARFDARLAFYNCNWFQERLEDLVESPATPVHTFVLDASSMGYIDSTGMKTFEELLTNLRHSHVKLCIASSTEATKDVLDRFGVSDQLGPSNFFPTVHAAVEAAVQEHERATKEVAASAASASANGTNGTNSQPAPPQSPDVEEAGSSELRRRRRGSHWWENLISSKPKETYIELGDI